MSRKPGPHRLTEQFVRLRSDASAELLPVTATFFADLSEGRLGDFRNEFLVSSYAFDADWPTWEMHPNGDELVYLVSGRATLVLKTDDGERSVRLSEPGSYVFVPRATMHTAKIAEPTLMLFITAGEGTENHPV